MVCLVSQQLLLDRRYSLYARLRKGGGTGTRTKLIAHLATCKKAAWDRWSNSVCPTEGPLYEEKIETRAEFRRRMNICAANEERKRVQLFDQRFKQKPLNHFKTSKICHQRTTLRVDQLVTSTLILS